MMKPGVPDEISRMRSQPQLRNDKCIMTSSALELQTKNVIEIIC